MASSPHLHRVRLELEVYENVGRPSSSIPILAYWGRVQNLEQNSRHPTTKDKSSMRQVTQWLPLSCRQCLVNLTLVCISSKPFLCLSARIATFGKFPNSV